MGVIEAGWPLCIAEEPVVDNNSSSIIVEDIASEVGFVVSGEQSVLVAFLWGGEDECPWPSLSDSTFSIVSSLLVSVALLLLTVSSNGRFRSFGFPSPAVDAAGFAADDCDNPRSSSSALVADAIDAVSFRRD